VESNEVSEPELVRAMFSATKCRKQLARVKEILMTELNLQSSCKAGVWLYAKS